MRPLIAVGESDLAHMHLQIGLLRLRNKNVHIYMCRVVLDPAGGWCQQPKQGFAYWPTIDYHVIVNHLVSRQLFVLTTLVTSKLLEKKNVAVHYAWQNQNEYISYCSVCGEAEQFLFSRAVCFEHRLV